MFKLFRSLADGTATSASLTDTVMDELAPDSIYVDGEPSFPLAAHITRVNALPYVDWKAVEFWTAALPVDQQAHAWSTCVTAWLLHLKEDLGSQYRLDEAGKALLLSTLEPTLARITLQFMERTSSRILRLLEGVAAVGDGRSVLIAFDDEDTYYRYVAYYYPEKGEFAFSGGMFIDSGLAHFVTVKSDLRSVEPTIVHEMTHASIAHLPLPLWLNEGLAVNTERALTQPSRPLYPAEEMHRKQVAFWGVREIQQFWSGSSFARSDDGSMLSYDLAQIMVEHMAKDWETFRAFVTTADRADSGRAAARTHLGVDLGDYVCALLERSDRRGWSPDPASWSHEPAADAPAARQSVD